MYREINSVQNFNIIHRGVLSIANLKIILFIFYKFSLKMTLKFVNALVDINIRFPHK